MALSLKPLGDRVVVEPIEQEEVTAGGIVLPETAKEKPQQGKVMAAGPGARTRRPNRRAARAARSELRTRDRSLAETALTTRGIVASRGCNG